MCDDSSWLSSGGLIKPTFTPQCWHTAAISSSSVETIIFDKRVLLSAASIVHAIRGLPPIGTMFLRGIDLEPPLAVISPTVS